jgi:putative ABC transport system permease protein
MSARSGFSNGYLLDPGLRLLFWAVLVAVAALSSVALFTDRVDRALSRQGAALLAADLAVEQGGPIPAGWLEQAHTLGLDTVLSVSFPSVIIAEQRPLLVQVKAVGAGYPLRGRLRVRTVDGEANQAPPPGSAWLEGRLRDRLGAQIGETRIQLGDIELQAAGLLVDEPDRGGSLCHVARRLTRA